jgi:hypothetical protein
MGNHASKSLAGKPRVEMESWRLNPENFRPARLEFKRNRLFAGRTDGGRDTREHRLRGAMNMSRRHQQRPRVAFK